MLCVREKEKEATKRENNFCWQKTFLFYIFFSVLYSLSLVFVSSLLLKYFYFCYFFRLQQEELATLLFLWFPISSKQRANNMK
jgi:hypothetical protein